MGEEGAVRAARPNDEERWGYFGTIDGYYNEGEHKEGEEEGQGKVKKWGFLWAKNRKNVLKSFEDIDNGN